MTEAESSELPSCASSQSLTRLLTAPSAVASTFTTTAKRRLVCVFCNLSCILAPCVANPPRRPPRCELCRRSAPRGPSAAAASAAAAAGPRTMRLAALMICLCTAGGLELSACPRLSRRSIVTGSLLLPLSLMCVPLPLVVTFLLLLMKERTARLVKMHVVWSAHRHAV